MRSVLLRGKEGSKREELEKSLKELETDHKLLDSIKEFVRFHTGAARRSPKKH